MDLELIAPDIFNAGFTVEQVNNAVDQIIVIKEPVEIIPPTKQQKIAFWQALVATGGKLSPKKSLSEVAGEVGITLKQAHSLLKQIRAIISARRAELQEVSE